MYRTVTIVSLCVLVAVLVALVIANSSTKEEEYTARSSRLESNNSLAQNDTENPEIVYVYPEESRRNITENEDIISEATDFVTHANFSQFEDLNNTISNTLEEKRKAIAEIQADIKQAEANFKEKQKRLDEIKQRALETRMLAKETQEQFELLITAMNVLQESILKSSMASNEAFWQLQLQTSKYNDAKRRYSKLVSELDLSRADYQQMKTAVEEASAAVKVALDHMDHGQSKA